MLQVALARNPVLDVIHGSWSRRPVGDNDLRVENHVHSSISISDTGHLGLVPLL
jgi:hypothetical protein